MLQLITLCSSGTLAAPVHRTRAGRRRLAREVEQEQHTMLQQRSQYRPASGTPGSLHIMRATTLSGQPIGAAENQPAALAGSMYWKAQRGEQRDTTRTRTCAIKQPCTGCRASHW